MKRLRLQAVLMLTASISAGFTTEALAQNSGSSGGLETVIVTAEKRAENLQQVPNAATAINGSDLLDKAVLNVSDLQYAAPGVSIENNGLTSSVNIRGIGLASGSASVSNGVTVYKDGLFQPQIVTSFTLFDIADAEVFRGPQGTFVGSNSTGGAIFINSRNPDFDGYGGYGIAGFGEYASRILQGAVNIQLDDALAIRVAGSYLRHNSYWHDVGTRAAPLPNVPIRPDSLDELQARVSVLWKPTNNFTAVLKVEGGDRDTGGYAYKPIPGTAYAPFAAAGSRNLNYDSITQNNERNSQIGLDMRLVTSSGITIKNLMGYQYKRVKNIYDNDGTNGQPFSDQYQLPWEKVMQEEVDIISPTDGRFSWVAGAYFQRNNIKFRITQDVGGPPGIGFPTDIGAQFQKTTTGVFAQGTFKFTDQFSVDAGARWSNFHEKAVGPGVLIGRGIPGFPPGGLQVADLGGSYSDNRPTGKIALNWTPDAGNLIYAFIARGYKPGGFSSRGVGFKPETVTDYELGWKSDFFNDHLRTQIGGFYYQYNNFQFDVTNPATGQGAPINLTNATVKGLEAQVQGNLAGFHFDGGLALVDSELGSVPFINSRKIALAYPGVSTGPQCAPGVPQTNPSACFNYIPFTQSTAGGPNLLSPNLSYNFSVEYPIDLQNDFVLTPRVNYGFLSKQYTYIGYDPVTDLLPSRGLLAAFLTLQMKDYALEGYVTNLTDAYYATGQANNANFYGPPREFGLRATVNF